MLEDVLRPHIVRQRIKTQDCMIARFLCYSTKEKFWSMYEIVLTHKYRVISLQSTDYCDDILALNKISAITYSGLLSNLCSICSIMAFTLGALLLNLP